MSSAGGTPATVTTPDASSGERHLLPQSLPGGKTLLFTTVTSEDWERANVVLHSLDTGERRVLVSGGADARYVGTGHLIRFSFVAKSFSTWAVDKRHTAWDR